MLNRAAFKFSCRWLFRLALSVSLLGVSYAANADTYPDRPVRLVVPFAAGSASDVYARLLSEKMGPLLGQSIVVENIAGAAGLIAANTVARANPDGYTIMLGATPWSVAPLLQKNPSYDPLKDFSLIGKIGTLPSVLLVSSKSPISDIKSLIKAAKETPGSLTFASSGPGSFSSLAVSYFASMAKIDLTEVPYKSSAQALQDTVAGRVNMNLPALTPALPFIQSGSVRGLAVFTAKRSSIAPGIPTLDESGFPGFDAAQWIGLVTTANTSPEIIEKLNSTLNQVLAMPDIASRFEQMSLQVEPSTQSEFASLVKADIDKWGELIKSLDIPLQ